MQDKPNERDRYWVAGFLEGEGYFINNGGAARLGAGQKDREPLDRLQRIVGGRIFVEKASRVNPIFRWNLAVRADVDRVLVWLYPLLSGRRRFQIDRMLGRRRPALIKTCCPRGHAYGPPQVDAKGRKRKHCRECAKQRWQAKKAGRPWP